MKPRVLSLALLSFLSLFTLGVTNAGQPISLRFLGSNFSFWPDFTSGNTQPTTSDPNARALIFTPPPGFPTGFIGPTNDTEFWSGFPYPPNSQYPDNHAANNYWPALTNYFAVGKACDNDITNDFATASVNVEIDDYLWPMPPDSTVADAMSVVLGWWQVNFPPVEDFDASDFNMTLKVKGGKYDGQTLTLPAAVATATLSATGTDAHNQEVFGDMFVVVDFGEDLLTNRNFLSFHFSSIARAAGGNLCLSLPTLCQQWLGSPDAMSCEQAIFNNLKQQLTGGQAYIQGAVPDLAFFYDFSGKYTVSPFQLTSGPSFFPPPIVDFSQVNQFDAGIFFNLPIATDGNRGGNACGPTSLTMAMNASGHSEFQLDQVFNNTMDKGHGVDGQDNEFNWWRALQWLEGKTTDGAVAFPNPLTYSLPVDFMQDSNAVRGWSRVDALLANKQPVLLRTDLGIFAGIGTGHVILLTGKGNSPNIAQLYGTSGDYYDVCDPAGHFFADTDSLQHYGTVGHLQTNWYGQTYGGWFAMYPAEKFRTRISLGGKPVVRALTIGQPFASSLELQAHSPVTILVTDPVGHQTGIDPNGAVIENIPDSAYEPNYTDSEDGSSINPDGPKIVRINTPMAGTYQIEFTGTNTGPYTFVAMQSDATGATLGTNSVSGNITPGQVASFTYTAVPSDPPSLLTAIQPGGVRLFWPTNYAGYSLQTTTTLSNPDSWAATGAASIEGGFNAYTNPTSLGLHFFRLKKSN